MGGWTGSGRAATGIDYGRLVSKVLSRYALFQINWHSRHGPGRVLSGMVDIQRP